MVKPTPEQVEWANCEIGVLIHYDVQVFHPTGYQFGNVPAPVLFNPIQLDTDQWIETAKAAGAGYAVLVAKHGSGFCLWPSSAHDYSILNSPYLNGQGDIVSNFIGSCEKYGLRPGIYYHTGYNAYCHVDNPGKVLSGDSEEQKHYNSIVIQQLMELWTNYGKLFEIWFDGGVLSLEKGGPDIVPLLWKHQPKAVVFQGPKGTPSLARWVGNEQGKAPYPCWSTVGDFTGDNECPPPGSGSAEGTVWAPAESDMPNRNHQWIWIEDTDYLLYSVDELVECYYLSVGRNTNLLIGMVIDNRGLVPDADVRQFAAFGNKIRHQFGREIKEVCGQGDTLTMDIGWPTQINHVVIMENIAEGERVREYIVEAMVDQEWTEICHGFSIGHKRIERFETIKASQVRFRCVSSIAVPLIQSLAVLKSN